MTSFTKCCSEIQKYVAEGDQEYNKEITNTNSRTAVTSRALGSRGLESGKGIKTQKYQLILFSKLSFYPL